MARPASTKLQVYFVTMPDRSIRLVQARNAIDAVKFVLGVDVSVKIATGNDALGAFKAGRQIESVPYQD